MIALARDEGFVAGKTVDDGYKDLGKGRAVHAFALAFIILFELRRYLNRPHQGLPSAPLCWRRR
jgi:hypothetical protein